MSTHVFFLVFLAVSSLAPCVLSSGNVSTSLPELASSLGPVVNLGYAAYIGNTTSPTGIDPGLVTFFGGIPYAQPPLRDLRFRAPQLLDEKIVDDPPIVDARNWGPPCIQQPAAVGVGSEDCLTVNIWKPSNVTDEDSLPVIVYIYGGGFYAGTTQGFPLYDWVAQHPGGVIGVSMGYRLNVLGFLASDALAADGNLNNGLLDQRAALEWVQRHIGKFGGNPEEVTIVGESAGGASVVMQIVAYGGAKAVPFKRAIAHSIGYGPTETDAQNEIFFKNVASSVGCPSSGTETMSCLRNASVRDIVNAINASPMGRICPTVDGPTGFLPELPSHLIAAGKFNTVDFIGGHCTNDGRTFVGGSPDQFVTDDDVRRLVFSRWPGVSNATIDKAMIIYPSPTAFGSPFSSQYERAWTMAQEIIFGCMDGYLADKMLERGVKNVFSFRWNAANPVLYNATPYEGVMHTSDLYFLFDGTTSGPNASATFRAFNTSEAALSKEAIAYWTSFVASGNPSLTKETSSPLWTQFEQSENIRRRIVPTKGNSLMTNTMMEVVPSDERRRCAFWMGNDIAVESGI